jgi:Zn-dependent peptidase ImmA (M78 family)/transcriptional regulator with XRE-family HTH domain
MADETRTRLAARIRRRREDLALTQKALADLAGFPVHQIVSQIETGERDVKAWELSRLAKALHASVADLLSEEEMAATPSLLWRKPPAGARAIREAEFTERCRRYAHVERLCGMEPPVEIGCACSLDLKQCSFGQAAELAAAVTRHLGLGDRPSAALVPALEERVRVKVWYFAMGDEASGACAWAEFGPAILMNASEAPWRRNFSFAHELFRLLTWKASRPEGVQRRAPFAERIEKLANVFASHLLLPADLTVAAFDRHVREKKVSYGDLTSIAREFGVSTEALLWRLTDLGRVSRATVDKLRAESGFRQMDRTSRHGEWWNPPSVPERFVRFAFLAHSRGRLSKAKLAEYLGVSLPDLAGTLLAYGYDEAADYDTTVPTAA